MGEPDYTVEEANRLLPELTRVLETVARELGLATDPETLSGLRRSSGHNGGGAAASAMLRAGRRLELEMAFLRQRGVLLRDAELGLVDFPARRAGRPIFLCWRPGEPEVGFWHPRNQGFSDRRPL